MRRNLIKFTITLLIGATIFGFSGCQPEITVTAPPDATIDLGESFDPMAGLIVEGAKEEDVVLLWNPTFNNNLVNEYVATYVVEGVSDQRSVFVRSNLLAGPYRVSDVVTGGGTFTYDVTVTQSGTAFNRILINGFADFDITVHADIVGNVITIPLQTPTNWTATESVQGTGTYDGVNRRLTSFTYTIKHGNPLVTETGTATYTKR